MKKPQSVLSHVMGNYHHFNAGALKRATMDYYDLVVRRKGKMFLAMAGAMSSARLGIVLAEAIRRGLIHGISCTGANLEESIFRLVADDHYKNFPRYRYHSCADETKILKRGGRRVTDLAIPEEEAFRKVERFLVPMWEGASADGTRAMWHEFFYHLVSDPRLKKEFQGDPRECWLMEAAKKELPMVVPGYADSTFGNIFSGHCVSQKCNPRIARSDVEQFMAFYDTYRKLSLGAGVGFFQIGGGIAGDFPICVVPSIKYDLRKPVKPWQYFCQVSDSVTSFGGYSGATPNEKITWDKITARTPMHVIESDATIVFPLILEALFEAQDNPRLAARLFAAERREAKRREFKF